MNTLINIQNEYKFDTDKGSTHTYLEKYDELFKEFKNEKINVLEIGALAGESLKLWSKYFPNATIYGVDTFERVSFNDVVENIKGYDNILLRNIDSFRGTDDTDKENWWVKKDREKALEEFEDEFFHIIIADGHHAGSAQVRTFNNFIGKLHSDGIYVIEDIKMYDGHSEHVIENIKNIEIIDMNENRSVKDNTLGIYKNV